MFILNETKIFKELNLSSVTKENDPQDFYTFMVDKLSFLFKEFCTSLDINEEYRESYKRLYNLILDRKNIKQGIMIIPYNASLFAITQYIKDTFKQCYYAKDHRYPKISDPVCIKYQRRDNLLLSFVNRLNRP